MESEKLKKFVKEHGIEYIWLESNGDKDVALILDFNEAFKFNNIMSSDDKSDGVVAYMKDGYIAVPCGQFSEIDLVDVFGIYNGE